MQFAAQFLLVASVILSGQSDEKSAVDRSFEQLSTKYGVAVQVAETAFEVKTQHGKIAGKPAGLRLLASYVPIFEVEWNQYPVELIRKTQLREIILCEALSFAGQPRAAVPDFEHNAMYYDVRRGRHSEVYVRQVIHHEFFHMIDYCDDGVVYADDGWAALNPKGFKYGSGGKNAQGDPTMSQFRADIPGFLNKYSTTGVEEDKAEVFAHMVVVGPAVDARAKKDKVVRAKVERMRELLVQFCPAMNEEFWHTTRHTQHALTTSPTKRSASGAKPVP